jgi:hypothetical protein
MIVEMRAYTLIPGALGSYLKEFETIAPVIAEHQGPLLGYFTSEVGALNRVFAMRGYATFEERQSCRRALLQDSRFMRAGETMMPMIQSQQTGS